ncbi:MAG TPA: hypothetical protein DEA96_02060 [Leptospiraceae bacterium]|nr:hypothetical protein [Spirochaetaceae bacterium]HBS03719.1 hypothetical protein [Leptospiraceae bacterium]|tara:strand:+ start:1062 stop:1889 length:828 start_codon:yes stop_codon:yes gene_type:complete
MDDLDELIEEIQTRSVGTDFEIPVSEVLDMLGLSLEEYVRFRYNRRSGSSGAGFADMADYFTRDSIHELLDLLEPDYPDVMERFEQSGLHFSSDALIQFQEFFVSILLNRFQAHRIDEELLETSLAACQDPEDGYLFYMDASFDRKQLIEYAAELFLEYRKIVDHSFSRGLLIHYLQRCFLSGQLDWEILFRHALDTLFPDRKVSHSIDLREDLREALKELELDYVPERQDLKKQFRHMMLRYHPDRNPDGLEKARRINESYSLLIAGLYGAEKI